MDFDIVKLFDEDGNEVEAVVASEVKDKFNENVEADVEKQIEEKTKELQDKITELEANPPKDGEGDDEGGDDDGTSNFKKLKESHEKEMSDLKKELDDYKNSVTGEHKTELLDKLAGDDKDLRAVLEKEYDGFDGEAVTANQVGERMQKAFSIHNPDKVGANISETITNVGTAANKITDTSSSKGEELSDAAKGFAKMAGATDEEINAGLNEVKES